MTASAVDVVTQILHAQGVVGTPTQEAIKVCQDALDDTWTEATRDAEYDAQMSRNYQSQR